MFSLRTRSLSFAHTDRIPLFSEVTVHLTPGWTGLVGANGSGKTTFLRLLAGELEPSAGELLYHPPEPRIELCVQMLEALDSSIRTFALAYDGQAQRLRGRLRLEVENVERWETLSPGERKRWQIGAALWCEPEMLLLDEPTNHLDGAARDLLSEALAGFRGVGVLVSHDRDLLNELTGSTLRLDHRRVRLWPGAYDAARDAWREEEAAALQAYESGRREERKLERRLADRRRRRDSAAARIGVRSRAKGRRDHDARSMAAKGRIRAAEKGLGRQVAVARRQLERQRSELASFRFEKAKGRALFVDFEPAPMGRLAVLGAAELTVGDRVLLRDVHLTLDRSTRVWLAGENGSGKTTLLRALKQRASVPAERLLSLPQELDSGSGRRRLEELRRLAPEGRGRVLELVAALGCDPERLLATESPSPGEARKLELAFGLGRRVWALLLDEPTNHLDLPSIERLESMLTAYPGALVLVTHDSRLARSCTEDLWRIEGGRIRS